jgi:hypothetical protein
VGDEEEEGGKVGREKTDKKKKGKERFTTP